MNPLQTDFMVRVHIQIERTNPIFKLNICIFLTNHTGYVKAD